ncbi:MAG: outer membrane beta-barrel protein [Phenylobacterium sp.]|uniref:outer membrane beta-barrel protein n=1 Tax=Phenylobacterium sp. TaxID=1871053 RepID=UPI002722919A|nr:outer membrane beta-barrel protein [Phenylobacterium sp.]MDO9429850.1 outer membrane beta-barrel protein [Phenylobacterium sp.]
MRSLQVAFGAAVGMVAISSEAFAQEARRLDFGLQALIEYNSNVAASTEEAAELRGLSRSDTLFSPTATIDFSAPVGRQAVFFRGLAGYTFYDKNKRLDRERLNGTGGVQSRLGPCAGTLSGGYMRGISQYDDPLLDAFVDNVQETKRVDGDVACSRSTGFGATGQVSKEWTGNEVNILKLSDYERTKIMLGATYTRPTLGTLTVFGTREETSYVNRPIDDGYEMNALGLTYSRQLGARIEGSVTVSANKLEQKRLSTAGDDLETTAYAASLSYRASSRLRFMGSFDRAVTPSQVIGRSYDIADVYRISGEYALGSRFMISGGVARAERDAGGGLTFPVVQLTESTTTTMFGSVRYKQSDRLSFVLNAGRDERSTNAPQFDYTNNRIGLRADVAF